MYNSITLCGRLTRNLELQRTETGRVFSKNSIAVNNIFSKRTDFINIIAWNARAENMVKFLKIGSLILIEGRLEVNIVGTENDRKTYYNVVIRNLVFLESKNSNFNKNSGNFDYKKNYDVSNNFDVKNVTKDIEKQKDNSETKTKTDLTEPEIDWDE